MKSWRVVSLSWLIWLMPVLSWAQAAGGIAGVVKDASGAVLPGVTVEASSPALIEKVRSVVSDDAGQYKIVDVVPGTYTVTFTLTGFITVKREGIALSAGFTAIINADMRVGGLEETITVSGTAPVVDTQNVIQQKVVTREVLESVPSSRTNYAALTPGASRSTDVGGTSGWDTGAVFTIHGSNANDERRLIDGMRWNTMEAGNSGYGFYVDPTAAAEVAIQLGGNSAEWELGGVQVNVIPKSGSNVFSGTLFGAYSNSNFNSTAVPSELAARGLSGVPAVDYLHDYSANVGGPIKKDKLWFFTTQRWWGNANFVGGDYYSNDTTAWTYQPNKNQPAENDNTARHHSARFTWQMAEKHKLNLEWDLQRNCACHQALSPAQAPEAAWGYNFGPPNYIVQATWSHPHSNKLLFEAGATTLIFTFYVNPTQPLPLGDSQISVIDVTRSFRYRSSGGSASKYGAYGPKTSDQSNQRFAMSYVTGSHNFKTGVQIMEGWRHYTQQPPGSMDFEFAGNCSLAPFTPCAPIALIEFATPNNETERLNADLGVFAQDQWTLRHLTLNLGVRFDYLNASAAATNLPAGPFVPARNFPAVPCVPCWQDVVPRLGAAYDLFGNGRTAVKVNLGKFVLGQAIDLAEALNPVNAAVYSTTRNWTEPNFVNGPVTALPSCDLTNPFANGACGPIDNLNFAKNNPRATQYAPNVLTGWGNRPYNWQFSASVQHELHPGVAVNVGYFRTWYGNFTVTENTAVTSADFTQFCVTAPSDPRLPGGGGNQVCGNYDVSPAKFGQSQTFVDINNNQRQVYNGVDATVNARIRGLYVNGGLSTGATSTNNCTIVQNNPQVSFGSPRIPAFCAPAAPWQAQYQFAAIYNLPMDFQTSAVLQSYPGINITGSSVYTNAQILPALGRNLASCGAAATCNGTSIINFLPPGLLFEDRSVQVDLRLAKARKLGHSKLQGMLDLFNAFNSHPILTENFRYSGATGGSFGQAQSTLVGRLLKLSAQFDF